MPSSVREYNHGTTKVFVNDDGSIALRFGGHRSWSQYWLNADQATDLVDFLTETMPARLTVER